MRLTALGASIVAVALLGASPAVAAPTVTEFTGGATPGFTANGSPFGITGTVDNGVWFTETAGPGRIGHVSLDNGAVTFTELTGGSTSGFSAGGVPFGIGIGPDSGVWFAQRADPGRVARVTASGVTEYTGGVTTGFTANSAPQFVGKGPDRLWFTQAADPGRISRVTPTGTVTQFVGGLTPGFSANGAPQQIVSDADGNMWFTERANPGRLGKITPQDDFSELTGGVTPGFSANGAPYGIAADPFGNVWFTQTAPPGRVAKVAPGGAVTEYTGGVTPGFSANAAPTSIVLGPDGNVWFLESASPGRVARLDASGQITEYAAGTTPGFTPDAGLGELAVGPDSRLWFTESAGPGRIGRMTVGPLGQTVAARPVTSTTARLNGAVRTNGQQTSAHFEYGRTTRYGSRTRDRVLDAGNVTVPVNADLTKLRPYTTYHFRLVATNDIDTAVGADSSFRTPAVAALASLRLSRKRFRVGRAATIRLRLRIAARVSLSVERPVAGRISRGRCVTPTAQLRSAPRCTRWDPLPGRSSRRLGKGRKNLRFTGRFGGRRVRPGRYRLSVTASAGGRGTVRTVIFRVLR